MAKDIETIKSEIYDHLQNKCTGKNYTDYYVGITKDIDDRLLGFHQVQEKHCWIWSETKSEEDARAVEKYFLDKGMDGGDGGGDEESVVVYCYLISNETKER